MSLKKTTLITEYFSLISTPILACSGFARVLGPVAGVAVEVTSPAGTCLVAQGDLPLWVPGQGPERFLCGQGSPESPASPQPCLCVPVQVGSRAHTSSEQL